MAYNQQLHRHCVGNKLFTEIVFAFNYLVPNWDSAQKQIHQDAVDDIFADMSDVFIHLQYLIIASKDVPSHKDAMERAMARISRSGMKLRGELSRWASECLEYNNASISEAGISITNKQNEHPAWFMETEISNLKKQKNESEEEKKNADKNNGVSRLTTFTNVAGIKSALRDNNIRYDDLRQWPSKAQEEEEMVYFLSKLFVPASIMKQFVEMDPRMVRIVMLLRYKERTLPFISGELTKAQLLNWVNPSKECLICFEDIDESPNVECKRGVCSCGECGARFCNVCTLQMALEDLDAVKGGCGDGFAPFKCPKCAFEKNSIFLQEFCAAMMDGGFLNEFENKEHKLLIAMLAKKSSNSGGGDNEKAAVDKCEYCDKKLTKSKGQRQQCKACGVSYCRAKCKNLDYKSHQEFCSNQKH